MKLAQFIQTNIEQLLEDWEEAVLEIAPELKSEKSRPLRNHAREMLNFITADLLTAQTEGESARKALGKGIPSILDTGGEYGIHSLQQGISILQMVQELRALRARITWAWGIEQQGLTEKDIGELVRFNEAIDELIATSIAGFSTLKNQVTRLIDAILKVSPDPTSIFNSKGKYLFINSAMADLLNASPREIIGKTSLELGLDMAPELEDAITTTVTTGQTQHRDLHHRSASGRELYFDVQLVPVYNDQNEIEAIVKTSRDITERKQNEYQTWRSANFDELTGLPNRRLFLDRLEQTLLEADRTGNAFALLFLDLDHFKEANDKHGHKAGDQLLEQVAERLTSSVRAMDTVARLGGDEFTLILKETGKDGAKKVAEDILAGLERTFEIDSHLIHISCSIGLAMFPRDGEDSDQLMHNADQAMYAAKNQGRQQIQAYESSMAQNDLTLQDDIRLIIELDNALKQNQLEVYYQPIIDIRTGAISSAEALLRWHHPNKGLLPPSDFLNIAKENSLTNSITAYVLEQAITSSLRWRDSNNEAFPISINESPASFITQSLVDQWQARLMEMGLRDSHITLELTPDSLKNIIACGFNPIKSLGLAGLGLHLSIDDFGIEPFSLSALQSFKMASVKVDRNLIKNAGKGGDADNVLESIIAMTHAIDVQVVGVGIERTAQLNFLTLAGCDYAQGFLFSHPINQEDFEALLTQDRQKKYS